MCWTSYTHESECDVRPVLGLPVGSTTSVVKMVELLVDQGCAPIQCSHKPDVHSRCPDHGCCRRVIRSGRCNFNATPILESCPGGLKQWNEYAQSPRPPTMGTPLTDTWKYDYPILKTPSSVGPRFTAIITTGKALATLARELQNQNTRLVANSQHNVTAKVKRVYTAEQRDAYFAILSAALDCWKALHVMIEDCKGAMDSEQTRRMETWFCLKEQREDRSAIQLMRVTDNHLYGRSG